ncbi:hypothetical protein [Metabacillus sediminilitoris]|uniref:Bacitracin ABC transporter ATP-binding protein n=1 Tax=Metabacillus sediminilitoris TaxID=2567941 RepID=A0A4S4C288_9BACI|nr:hypothetical protein [Metabacillus sediminilitoris]QGQ47752.1 bacitracin ABC transporter ATP-binding protein [Metabacillus sediminilitoris]THF81135.1 bacitracin ABC transporter ATP-binding protein [Metabacillus sediminilitoris]
MKKETEPLLSDEFLDEIAREINELYGGSLDEQNEEQGVQSKIE